MNNIKSQFSIKDLENLSGIKAHTIRIWEKRYNLLEPERTETNIRYYNLESLQKLLNIAFLNENGYKISKIASLENDKIPNIVRQMALDGKDSNAALQSFKLAMLNFDQFLFYETYDKLSKEKSFQEIFYEVFIPLMNDIGLLWQTDTIMPSHEHFIFSLIRQKLISNIESLQVELKPNSEYTYVFFLPDNEIHELGLMLLNYEFLSLGHHCIFLGQSVPLSSLSPLLAIYKKLIFISCFTTKPEKENLQTYLQEFERDLLQNNSNELWTLGRITENIDFDLPSNQIKIFYSLNNLVKELEVFNIEQA